MSLIECSLLLLKSYRKAGVPAIRVATNPDLFPGFDSREPAGCQTLQGTKGGRGVSDARPGARRGTVFSRTKSAQARVLVPLKATNADLFPGFNSKELAECRRFTRDERRAGRVGREAGGEAGDGSLENEKRTGKSACATQGENRKSRQDVGFLRDSCFSEFLAWDRT